MPEAKNTWTAIGMFATGLSLVSILQHPHGFNGLNYYMWKIVSDRCPKCGYKWTQPVASLQGKECW